jgi:hypothetical protein
VPVSDSIFIWEADRLEVSDLDPRLSKRHTCKRGSWTSSDRVCFLQGSAVRQPVPYRGPTEITGADSLSFLGVSRTLHSERLFCCVYVKRPGLVTETAAVDIKVYIEDAEEKIMGFWDCEWHHLCDASESEGDERKMIPPLIHVASERNRYR